MYDFFDYENEKWQKGFHCVRLGDRKTTKEIVKQNAGKKIWYLIKRDIDTSGRGLFWARKGVLTGEMFRGLIELDDSSYDREIDLEDIRDFAIEND